jgi:hypothetical protein
VIRKKSAGIPLDVWEVALRRHVLRRRKATRARPMSDLKLAHVARTAFRLAKTDLPDDELDDWVSDMFPEVLADAELATVGVGWPESHHGDALWITVSAFPGGTVMGTRRDSWGGREDLVFYFTIPPSLDELLSVAENAAYNDDAVHGGNYAFYDEDNERPEDPDATPAKLFGFKKLRAAWSRRLRSLSTTKRAKGRRAVPSKSTRKQSVATRRRSRS